MVKPPPPKRQETSTEAEVIDSFFLSEYQNGSSSPIIGF